jgi:hypothetical protein
MKLKKNPGHIKPFMGRSDVLIATKVPKGTEPQSWYLANARENSTLPPCISGSEFVPSSMIEHLMRNKKDSAIGVKFQHGKHPPDAITNMEGAIHTFVTPLVLATIHGDYVYSHGHGVSQYDSVNGMQQARKVIISAQVQPDFEGPDVMQALCTLQDRPIVGEPLPHGFSILSVTEKQSSSRRAAYNASLQRHIVFHLTKAHRLPSQQETEHSPWNLDQAIAFLEDLIRSSSPRFNGIQGRCIRPHKGTVLSLEMLFQTALHQLRNELSALEILSPQGYIYTSDPPAIFAAQIGATILNRLQFAALKSLSAENHFKGMRVFAFNDYLDKPAVKLLKHALETQKHVKVVSKSALFQGPKGTYYALPVTEGALLVLHNNSDAFGQNIETEKGFGSMDAVFGVYSNAAACLEKTRPDLLSNVM